jgi:hypothetical protein
LRVEGAHDLSVSEGIQLALNELEEETRGLVILCGSLFACADARLWLAKDLCREQFHQDDWVYQHEDLTGTIYK